MNSQPPKISVLMGVYNEEEFLSRAIESILEQSFENFEFLIVDDASTDSSPEIVRSYDDDRITFIRNSTNQGLTRSLNHALDQAVGKYVARQDADDISYPDRFEKQVNFLENHEEVTLVGSGAHLIDESENVTERRIVYCSPDFDELLDKNHLIHGSVMGRKETFEAFNGYDEFFRYGQDYDLWLRLAKEYEIRIIPEPLYKLRLHDESIYFDKKNESALYTMLARDLATNRVDRSITDELNGEITNYYDLLSESRKRDFHVDLATRYLRYGHLEPAKFELRKARKYGTDSIMEYLLTMLTMSGEYPVQVARWVMRKYLNASTRIRNRLASLRMTT